jgi:branched-chain amino acid transport system permease protein
VSLQMVFAAIVGGLYVALGPTVGAVITILMAEILRIGFGTKAVGWDNLIYGVLLVLFIIFLPKGILGSVLDAIRNWRRPSARAPRRGRRRLRQTPSATTPRCRSPCRAR